MNFILQFSSWADFLAMGKHGLYVWSSYALTLVLLFSCLLVPWLKLKRTRHQLTRLIHRQAAFKEDINSQEVSPEEASQKEASQA